MITDVINLSNIRTFVDGVCRYYCTDFVLSVSFNPVLSKVFRIFPIPIMNIVPRRLTQSKTSIGNLLKWKPSAHLVSLFKTLVLL